MSTEITLSILEMFAEKLKASHNSHVVEVGMLLRYTIDECEKMNKMTDEELRAIAYPNIERAE